MVLFVIYLLFSFILEAFMSNFFVSTFSDMSYFTTIYTVISLVIIYSYFYNHKKYYILVVIFGILFDFLYTSTFLVNVFIFLLLTIIIKILNNIVPENIVMINFISITSVICYHALSFIILSITGSIDYSIVLLGKIIIHSIVMTIIYTSISYLIVKYLFNGFDLKEIK